MVGAVGGEREDGHAGVSELAGDPSEEPDELERELQLEGQQPPSRLDRVSGCGVVGASLHDHGPLPFVVEDRERARDGVCRPQHVVGLGRDGHLAPREQVVDVHEHTTRRDPISVSRCVLAVTHERCVPPCHAPRSLILVSAALATMPGPVFIQGETVSLHAVGEDDLDFLRETVLDPNVRQTIGLRQPLTEKQEREWYEEHASGDERVHLVACIPESSVPDGVDPREDEDATVRVGSLGLGPVNDLDGNAEVGISVAEPFWGNGFGTEAARLLTDYGFRDLRKHRIVARVIDGNVGSQRIWEKLGYEHEAVHREEQFLDGEHVDVHYYSVLADEWLERD